MYVEVNLLNYQVFDEEGHLVHINSGTLKNGGKNMLNEHGERSPYKILCDDLMVELWV